MPESSVFERLVVIAEFMLQARLPESTKQLLAATVDQFGESMFAPWLATYDAVAAAGDEDKRLIIREQTQEQWVNSMRMIAHPLPQALAGIYDAANAPIAPGMPPLTAEAADAVLDMYAFQSSIVKGSEVSVPPAQRHNWQRQLAACYPMLDPGNQQWIATAPLSAPMMRAGWKELTPSQKQAQRQAWAAGLPQVKAWVGSIMQGPAAGGPVQAAQGQTGGMTPQQTRQHDQQVIQALQSVSNSQYQAGMAVAHNMRA
jgi:hypothetical protein